MDPFSVLVCGKDRFPEHQWLAAIRQFLYEISVNSTAVQENPSIAFGSVTLKLDRSSNRYYAYGTKPETPREKSVRSAKDTGCGILTVSNSREEVEYALSVIADGGVITRLQIHFDISRRGTGASTGELILSDPALFIWGLESGIEYVVNIHNLPVEDPLLEGSVT